MTSPAAPLVDPDAPTATALAAQVRAGRSDPAELVERALARWEQVDGVLRAFVHVDVEGARAQARERTAALRAGGPLGPLHGVPVAVKDLFDVAGQVTRAGSRVPAGPPAAADAPAVARLRAAGAVVLGRTRTHEYAWGLLTQHPDLGGTGNPYDPDRVPGGSSGGSAVAVAAGVVPVALGTDTGCSLRLPAAWCGLVGHKPTYGLVPLDGVVPLAASMDHGGALVRDVADTRLLLALLSGRELPPPAPLAGLRLGVADGEGLPPLAPGIARRVQEAVARAEEAVGPARPVRLPLDGDRARRLYGDVQSGEALAWHRATGRWPQHAALYGADVRGRLQACERVTPEQLAAADALRAELRAAYAALFEQVDLLLLPVAATGPPRVADDGAVDVGGRRSDVRKSVMPWTVPANLCGLPACAVPAGLDDDGLPVGVQVVGPPGADARVLDLAAALQG